MKQRKIKFRVWNKTLDSWRSICIFENSIIKDSSSDIIMQFTGLKDRRDKEIWEGDRIYIKWNGFGEVVFEYGEFFVKGEKGKTTPLSNNWGDKCEVIGNKFENPELNQILKTKHKMEMKLISKCIRKSRKTGKLRVVYARLQCPCCKRIIRTKT